MRLYTGCTGSAEAAKFRPTDAGATDREQPMYTNEINKIAGALLATVLFIVMLHILGNEIFDPHVPTETAMAVDTEASEATTDEVAEVRLLPVLLAAGDAVVGERIARKCVSCHTFDEGGKNKVGPNLWNVLGSDLASVEGFRYSGAMKDADGSWDYARLDAFIANPRAALKGNKMTFIGIKEPAQRADVILYLRSLSAAPMALPQ